MNSHNQPLHYVWAWQTEGISLILSGKGEPDFIQKPSFPFNSPLHSEYRLKKEFYIHTIDDNSSHGLE